MTLAPVACPADVPRWRIVNAKVPIALVEGHGIAGGTDGLAPVDIAITEGRIGSILPAGLVWPDEEETPSLDLAGGIVLPGLVDAHTHLDKGHVWPRAANPNGSFMGALETVTADREANWTARDVAARMEFGLACAHAHGTTTIRTHLDSIGKQTAISWQVFSGMRERWRGRIDLQAACLFGIDYALDDRHMAEIERVLTTHGGTLGAVTYMGPSLDAGLERLFRMAIDLGLDLDFHVDEATDPQARSLERIADTAIRFGFEGRILCGHCCSLALQEPDHIIRVIEKVARANIAVVSLPMCNMYLQDRTARRTPRWRGVTLLHELKQAGVPVMVSSDNTRDPFHAYGDLDLVEVYGQATRIAHLDHPVGDWPKAVAATPAQMIRRPEAGRLAAGRAADLILLRARSWTELLSRPQADRTVIRGGRRIDRTLPDYRTLDPLFR
jgi:cytosine deaminase